MLVLPNEAAPPPNVSGLPPIFDDPSWEPAVYGSATLMIISSLAIEILRFPPIRVISWVTIGFISGFLAKKTINHYNFTRSFARTALTIDERLPYVRVVALCISFFVSFCFPTISAIGAACVGLYGGYLFRYQRGAP